MNDKAREVLQYIIDYKVTHDGNAPVQRNIAAALKITVSSVNRYIHILAELGHLDLKDFKICLRGGIYVPPEMPDD